MLIQFYYFREFVNSCRCTILSSNDSDENYFIWDL